MTEQGECIHIWCCEGSLSAVHVPLCASSRQASPRAGTVPRQ